MTKRNKLFELISMPAQTELGKAPLYLVNNQWRRGSSTLAGGGTYYHLYLLGDRPARNGEYAITATGKIRLLDSKQVVLWSYDSRPIVASTDQTLNQSVPMHLLSIDEATVNHFIQRKGQLYNVSLVVTPSLLPVVSNKNETIPLLGEHFDRPTVYAAEAVDELLAAAYFHAWMAATDTKKDRSFVQYPPDVDTHDIPDYAYTEFRRKQGLADDHGNS